MIAPTTKFEGGRELEAALRQLPQAIAKNVTANAMKDAVKPMVADMQANAPKQTGEAAAGIHAAVIKVDGHGATVAVGPDREGFYLQFREWGTAKLPAVPFMRPAWDAHKDGILKALGAAWWAQLAKAAQRLARK